MKYLPRRNWVLVNLLANDKSQGGILLPETAKERRLARVECVGPGERYPDGKVHPIEDLKPGDIVMVVPPWEPRHDRFSRKEINHERIVGDRNDNRILVMDEEVICVVIPEETGADKPTIVA